MTHPASDARYKKDKVPVMKDGKPVLDDNGKPKLMDQTYCNVYGADMVNAMGGYLPRVWYNEDLTSPTKLPRTAPTISEAPRTQSSPRTLPGTSAETSRFENRYSGSRKRLPMQRSTRKSSSSFES